MKKRKKNKKQKDGGIYTSIRAGYIAKGRTKSVSRTHVKTLNDLL